MNHISRNVFGGIAAMALLLAASSGFAQRNGAPLPGVLGVVNTTAEIQARQVVLDIANAGKSPVYLDKPYFSVDRTKLRSGPASLTPPTDIKSSLSRNGGMQKMQTLSTNFLGANLADALAFPPDSMGTIGPDQFIVAINGRIRSFDKVTGIQDGVLDVTANAFFAPGMTPIGGPITTNGVSDPRIRYDRGTRRWILVIIDVPNGGTAANRIIIVVSDTPVISAATTWTYFFIPTVNPTDFIDYPTLGVDANALYIGGNIFSTSGPFVNTDVWVVRKSSVLGAGPIVTTAFPNLISDINCSLGTDVGAWTPQGVDNFDFSPAPTEGYFAAVDACQFDKLLVYRVSTPAGTPTLSAPTQLAVAATSFAGDVPHLGNNGGSGPALGRLDGLDDRLYAAQIRGGRLWTAHSFLVESTGVAMNPGAPTTTARNGVRWYELQNLTTTPSVAQTGTIFDPTPGNAQTLDIKWYWIPSINVTGQGHAAVGFSSAGPFARANAAYTGRLAGDALGTMDPVTNITNTVYAYNPPGDGGGSRGRRWGDYSYTSVDPLDNMTVWTIQDYAEAPNSWGVRAAKLLAPPPSVPTSVSVPTVAAGSTNVAMTVTGTAFAGSGYFDPSGSTTFTRIGVVIPGVTVQSVTLTTPQTLNIIISTVGSTPGPKIVQVTNPDGQVVRSATALLTVTGTSAPQITSSNSTICAVGAPCNFTFTTVSGPATSTFSTTGTLPSGVTFTTPSLSGTPAAGTQGTYTLTVTASNGTLPNAVQTFKLIVTASCGGFSDVTGTDIFCNSAEWLRNRGVTLGCTPTAFCPADTVTRAQMALFMQRLGDVIAPTWYSDGVVNTGVITIDGGASVCATPDFPAVNYPRTAMVTWSFAGLAGAPLTARVWSRTSIDGGTTFTGNEANFMRVTSQGFGWASSSATVKVAIAAGSAPRFALRLDREAGTTTSGNFIDGRCNIAVSLASVNGGASPYDVPTVSREIP